jgi:hypothetical protein
MIAAVYIHDVFAERILKSRATSRNGQNIPEDHLPLMAYLSWTLPAGMFWYGWSTYYQVHWIVPILGTVLVGMGAVFIMVRSLISSLLSEPSSACPTELLIYHRRCHKRFILSRHLAQKPVRRLWP